MDKLKEVRDVLSELHGWRSSRQSKGLDAEPLLRAIKYLKEYRGVLKAINEPYYEPSDFQD
jgi:hypothetical protein